VLADMTDDQPKRGRPSDYSFQVAISICAQLAEGKSLRAICSDAGMPGRATVFRWFERHKEFRDEYTLACELRAEDLADEMIEIAPTSMALHQIAKHHHHGPLPPQKARHGQAGPAEW
jgi:hypothetical protein